MPIVLFNRAKDFSAVLAKIPEAVAAHRSHNRQEAYNHENDFRFCFRQKDDAAREMLLGARVQRAGAGRKASQRPGNEDHKPRLDNLHRAR